MTMAETKKQELVGKVISSKNNKTITVLVETYKKDPIYGKRVKRTALGIRQARFKMDYVIIYYVCKALRKPRKASRPLHSTIPLRGTINPQLPQQPLSYRRSLQQ